jgi:hypothetical protein
MRLLTVVVCAMVVIGSLVWFVNKYFGIEAHAIAERLWPIPTAEQLETRKLRDIAGWFSVNCGHIRRHENADVAISCATNALTARKPFYISFDFIGFDSRGIIGLAADHSGKVFSGYDGSTGARRIRGDCDFRPNSQADRRSM